MCHLHPDQHNTSDWDKRQFHYHHKHAANCHAVVSWSGAWPGTGVWGRNYAHALEWYRIWEPLVEFPTTSLSRHAESPGPAPGLFLSQGVSTNRSCASRALWVSKLSRMVVLARPAVSGCRLTVVRATNIKTRQRKMNCLRTTFYCVPLPWKGLSSLQRIEDSVRAVRRDISSRKS